MNALILLVYEIRRFSENFVIFSKFEIPIPVIGGYRVLSGVANLASNYDFSNFFYVFQI